MATPYTRDLPATERLDSFLPGIIAEACRDDPLKAETKRTTLIHVPKDAQRFVVILAMLALAGGCDRSWRAETTQTSLQLGSTDLARTSMSQRIRLGDMQLPPRVKLSNSVYFVVVSKDRLRFHVNLRHRNQTIANPSHWRVWIEDGQGNRHRPEGIDRLTMTPVSSSYEAIVRDQPTNDLPLYMVTFFEGKGDYTFYERDIFQGDMNELTLVMQQPGYEYRYTWRFVPDDSERAVDVAQL